MVNPCVFPDFGELNTISDILLFWRPEPLHIGERAENALKDTPARLCDSGRRGITR